MRSYDQPALAQPPLFIIHHSSFIIHLRACSQRLPPATLKRAQRLTPIKPRSAHIAKKVLTDFRFFSSIAPSKKIFSEKQNEKTKYHIYHGVEPFAHSLWSQRESATRSQ